MFDNYRIRERIKECMNTELPEIKQLYEQNIKMQNIQAKKDVEKDVDKK